MRALHAAGFPVPAPVACSRHTVVMSLVRGTPLYQIRHLGQRHARALYAELMALIVRLAGVGLIHGDFNEFNVMVEEEHDDERHEEEEEAYMPPLTGAEAEAAAAAEEEKEEEEETTERITLRPILIDFPQMLSVSHPNAATYFDRDVACVKRYFSRRYHFTSDDPGPFFPDVEKRQLMMRRKKGTEGGGNGAIGDDRRLDVEVEASGFSRKMAKELEKYMEEVGADGDGDDGLDSGAGDDSDEFSGNGDSEDGKPALLLADEVPDAGSLESRSFNNEAIRETEIPTAQLASVSIAQVIP